MLQWENDNRRSLQTGRTRKYQKERGLFKSKKKLLTRLENGNNAKEIRRGNLWMNDGDQCGAAQCTRRPAARRSAARGAADAFHTRRLVRRAPARSTNRLTSARSSFSLNHLNIATIPIVLQAVLQVKLYSLRIY
jgi:hypothetical protein